MTILSAASLLSCLATVALGVRSYVRSDRVQAWLDPSRLVFAYSGRGGVQVSLIRTDTAPRSGVPFSWANVAHIVETDPADVSSPPLPGERVLRSAEALGFGLRQTRGPPRGVTHTFVYVPHWFLALCFGVVPARRLLARRTARRRAARGCCVRCGYDLRATADRCPECGTPANVRAAAVAT